jgi:osmoprotectant transport system substrate-binding protein
VRIRRGRGAATALLALVLALGVAACGSSEGGNTASAGSTTSGKKGGSAIVSNPDNGKVTLTIGAKSFPEQEVLGEVYGQALEAAGYRVKKAVTSEAAALQRLKSGRISGYPEYTNIALTSFFGVKPEDVPGKASAAYGKAKEEFERVGLTAFPPTRFSSAYTVGALRKTADELDLKTISDLEGKSEELSLSGDPPGCRQRIDCLGGLEKHYGLKFKSFTGGAGLRYTALEQGQADLSILFATDPQLAAERDKFMILKDDKHVFPAANNIFVTKPSVVERAGPDYEKTIVEVQKGLTLPVMQELNARVELEGQSPAKAAAGFLKDAGYAG